MNSKMPVSALQELMAARGHPLPVYVDEGSGTSFKCTVYVENISAVGYGTTKKGAKHESAKNALEKLQGHQLVPLKPQGPAFSVKVEGPMKNYVGNLNEYSSKNGLHYPTYEFVTALVSGQFIFKCIFLGEEVTGIGMNKKDAKQDAAKNMLEKIQSGSISKGGSNYKVTLHQKKTFEVENIEAIYSEFKKLSMSSNKEPISKIDGLEPSPGITITEEDSIEILIDKLKKEKIEYSINIMQTHPSYVIYLIIKNTDITFLEIGKSKEEALKKLYERVLAVKKTGCSLNHNLKELL